MQRSLNRIDKEKRDKNVIIVGLPEDKIEIDNNDELASDVEKSGLLTVPEIDTLLMRTSIT